METAAIASLPSTTKPTFMYQSFNYSLHKNETTISTSSVIVVDLGMRELIFFAFMLLFLHAYLALIRRAWPLPDEQEDLESGDGLARDGIANGRFSALRETTRPSSGLTIEQIDQRLDEFPIDDSSHADDNSDTPKYVTIESGKRKQNGDCVVNFEQDVCAICLDDWQCGNGGKLRRLPCDHIFHQGKCPHQPSQAATCILIALPGSY